MSSPLGNTLVTRLTLFGWALVGAPRHRYTVGLSATHHHPELVFQDLGTGVGNQMIEQVEEGRRFAPGEYQINGLKVIVSRLEPSRLWAMVPVAMRFLNQDVEALLVEYVEEARARHRSEP